MLKKPNQQKKNPYKAQPKPSKAEEAVYVSIVVLGFFLPNRLLMCSSIYLPTTICALKQHIMR